MSGAKGVEAVDRALKILDCFDNDNQELSLADLARRTGLYKSTILRLCASLENFAYLARGERGLFRLGPTTWRLGASYRRRFDLGALIRPELAALSEAASETASFYVRDGDLRICLYRAEPARAIRHAIEEGKTLPLDRGASGRVLLAFGGADDPASRRIRSEGYALSMGERDPEVAALAVPLIAKSGRLVGALAVSGLITRFETNPPPTFLEPLLESKERLEKALLQS